MKHGMLFRLTGTFALTLGLLAGTTPVAQASDDALVRAAHFSPDTPGVDVYLTAFSGGQSRLWVPDAEYGGVSPYQRVPAGLYVVAMRPHGASAASKPVISWNLNLKAGQVYTTAAIGANAKLRSIVLHDDLALPPAGEGRIRLVQAASRAPRAEVVALHGPTVAKAAAFATTTGYTTVPAGTWSLQATAVGAPSLSTDARVSVAPGSVTSVLLLDAPHGGITIRSVVDAAAAGTVPVGAVPAGGGALAPNRPPAAPGAALRPELFGLAAAVALAGLSISGFLLGRPTARRRRAALARR